MAGVEERTRKALEAEVAARVLSPHQRRLLELADNGKSPHALAQLYRQYEGENGVRSAIEQARAKVRAAINGAAHPGDRPLHAVLADAMDEEGDGGIPVRRVPAGMLDAEAGGAPAARHPPRPQREQPSSAASTLPAVVDSPTRAASRASERQAKLDAVRAYLTEHGQGTPGAMRRATHIKKGSMTAVMAQLRALQEVHIVRYEGNAPVYVLGAGEDVPRPGSEHVEPPAAAEQALVPRELPPAPPPFAGEHGPVEAAVRERLDPDAPTLAGLQLRYLDTLVSELERWVESDDSLPEALCDRIERVSGLANGSAQQARTQIAAGDEPG
jgi:hypothetical protein